MQLYHEIAIGSPRNRGLLIPEQSLIDVMLKHGDTQPVYKSLYLYDDEGKEYHKLRKTFKNFLGKRYVNDILIDIDDEMLQLLQEQISQVKERISKEKSTYSWKLYSCGKNNSCKNTLIQQFLKQLFNYGGG